MATTAVILVFAAFLASAVEAVEALTVVLAAGATRGWRSALFGAGAAILALAAVIAVLGPSLSAMWYCPHRRRTTRPAWSECLVGDACGRRGSAGDLDRAGSPAVGLALPATFSFVDRYFPGENRHGHLSRAFC
jgi:hypothetical protein